MVPETLYQALAVTSTLNGPFCPLDTPMNLLYYMSVVWRIQQGARLEEIQKEVQG
jgi:hypothetical protein